MKIEIFGIIVGIIICLPLFFMIFTITNDAFFVNNFCIEKGFVGSDNSGFINYCVSKGAYEPNIPIDCDKDSVTGQRFCELRPDGFAPKVSLAPKVCFLHFKSKTKKGVKMSEGKG